MSAFALRRWRWLHRWSSVVCTLFLLVLCLTGLPLIFSQEIARALSGVQRSHSGPVTPAVLDAAIARAKMVHPGEVVRNLGLEPDTGSIVIHTGASPETPFAQTHEALFDAQDGSLLREGASPGDAVLDTLLQMHKSLFAGLPGELFIGVVGIAFLLALVSGMVLYAPFARRLEFGEIRRTGHRRLSWLDAHNMIGIVTLCWASVIGLTGVMNALATPLFGLYQIRDVAPVLRPYFHHEAIVPQVPLSVAVEAAEGALPGDTLRFATFPTHLFGSPLHYVIWLSGASKLRSRLLIPVLVDARDGHVAFVAQLPWYLRALEICRPLHFGDYGGLLVKILWAALDGLTIAVLGSGLYLLVARPGRSQARHDRGTGEASRLVEGQT